MAAVTTNAAALQGVKLNTSSLADTQVLTYDSASGTWMNKAASGGGGSSTPYAAVSSNYESLDGFIINTSGTGTASFPAATGYPRLSCTALNDLAWIYKLTAPNALFSAWPTTLYGSWDITISGATGDNNVYAWWYTDNNSPTTATRGHIGLNLSRTGGTTNPKTSTADGTTEQAIAISGVSYSSGTFHRYAFKFDGTSVSFYVDGVLKNTHSTNVPVSNANNWQHMGHAYVKALTADTTFMQLGRFFMGWPVLG